MNNVSKFLFGLSFLALGSLAFTACEKTNPEDDNGIVKDDNAILNEDQFTHDASGWTVVGDAQGSSVEPKWAKTGGVSGGYIYAKDDVTGGIWYFKAPDAYVGDKSSYYGGTLRYSLFQKSSQNAQFVYADVIIQGEQQQIYHLYDSEADFPNDYWTPYKIKIAAGFGWYVGDYDGLDDTVEASAQVIKDVMSSVTDLRIRGEFEDGPDKGGLDDVVISAKK